MDRQAAAPRQRQRVLEIIHSYDTTTDRVLECEEARAREMRIVGADRRLDLIQIKGAIGPIRDHLRMDRAQHAESAGLISIAVLLGAEDDAFAALAMTDEGREIGLRARGKEKRGLEAEDFCRARLQPVDRGVVAEDI